MTLRCTSLGWQGWIFEAPGARIAVDPLLLDEVGRGPRHTRAFTSSRGSSRSIASRRSTRS